MSIELWAARLERPLTERETAAMLRLLPEARRERLLRIKQPEKGRFRDKEIFHVKKSQRRK